jgi:hypothetical protein
MSLSNLVMRLTVSTAVVLVAGSAIGCGPAATAPTQSSTSSTASAARLSVRGTVTDPGGAPVAGVLVKAGVTGSYYVPVSSANTDSAGRFVLDVGYPQAGLTVVISTERVDYVSYSRALSPPLNRDIDLALTLIPFVKFPPAGTFAGELLTTARPAYMGEPYESDYAYQAVTFDVAALGDGDLDLVLDWTRAGNAALRMWANEGMTVSVADGNRQRIHLPRGSGRTLIVGQAYVAGDLTQNVPFTLSAVR